MCRLVRVHSRSGVWRWMSLILHCCLVFLPNASLMHLRNIEQKYSCEHVILGHVFKEESARHLPPILM